LSFPVERRKWLLGSLATSALAACGRRLDPSGRNCAALWYSYGGKNREVLESLVARFNREKRAAWIEGTFQGDYFEALAKLRTAIAARAAPALSHVIGEVIPYLTEAQVLEPLDGYEGAGELDLIPALAQTGTFAGGGARSLVAVPFNRSTPIMYVNRAKLERAGVAVPGTWADLRDAAGRLTERTSRETRVWGFECPISWWFWVALLGAAGGDLVDETGQITLGGDAGVKALELWQTLVHRDRAMRPPLGRDYNAWQVAMQDFLSERAAILWSSTAFMRYVEENARFDVAAAPLPRDLRQAVPTGGTFFVILRAAEPEAKRAAWDFIRWMAEPEQTIEWATSTGYMPVSRGAVRALTERGHYDRHPNDRVALAQLEAARPWPWSADLFRVEREIMDPLLEDAVLENRDAAAVLAAARRDAARP
jgi:sn-glycerol 3-phosphate transport system substrate-binding protein